MGKEGKKNLTHYHVINEITEVDGMEGFEETEIE
jgi:hypothetical protein